MSSSSIIKKGTYFLFAFLAIGVGLYPLLFVFSGSHFNLLDTKSQELLASIIWNTAFYSHLVFGGLALLIGWIQFNEKWRSRNLNAHRLIGKAYVIFAILSALGGIYLGFFATGGFTTAVGFISLGLVWLYSTVMAYWDIRAGRIEAHQHKMIYSYAACFAAVTLRLYLPLLTIYFQDFEIAYKIVAWLCWVPNLIVAFFIIQKSQKTIVAH